MENMTSFDAVYESFFSKITDDMYMEMTEEDTKRDAKDILMSALPSFEFPRHSIFDYDKKLEVFNDVLDDEEINIIATYMIVEWLSRQTASVENSRMKYPGSDFKMSSQANHMSKLQSLMKHYTTQAFHLQRLYGRRKDDGKGKKKANWSRIMQTDKGEWNFVSKP